MQLITLLQRKLRGIIQRYGSSATKQKLWDREFLSGKWDCLNEMRGDCLYATLERYSQGRTILDLGCGPGTTANEINGDYLWCTGVDISRVALEKARLRSAETGRPCEFVCSDIASYVPIRLYDVIAFADSLYYVPQHAVATVLHRYSAYLSPEGVFIARIKGVRPEWFDATARKTREYGHWARRKAIVSVILNQFAVTQCDLFHYSDVICVVVFRPRSA